MLFFSVDLEWACQSNYCQGFKRDAHDDLDDVFTPSRDYMTYGAFIDSMVD